MKPHHYSTHLTWTGNKGLGTQSYTSYSRIFSVQIENKPILEGSADPAFRGDSTRYNPEELLLISISSCHMLWYLHLCSNQGITVISYEDYPNGRMIESSDGSGRFEKVVLNPHVVILDEINTSLAEELHEQAHKKCFIANSCNFPIAYQPIIQIKNIGPS